MIEGIVIGSILGCVVTCAIVIPRQKVVKASVGALREHIRRQEQWLDMEHNFGEFWRKEAERYEAAFRLVAGERADRILSLHHIGREQ